jgi:hypothetical protein
MLVNIRAYPLRSDTIGLWGGLMLGGTWQTASASGASIPGTFDVKPVTYKVDAGANSGFSLGFGLGMDYDISPDLGFLMSVNLLNHQLSSEPLKQESPEQPLVPGLGSATYFDWRAAFQYRFDLKGIKPPVSATVQTARQ